MSNSNSYDVVAKELDYVMVNEVLASLPLGSPGDDTRGIVSSCHATLVRLNCIRRV